jgi:hypothetical protein
LIELKEMLYALGLPPITILQGSRKTAKDAILASTAQQLSCQHGERRKAAKKRRIFIAGQNRHGGSKRMDSAACRPGNKAWRIAATGEAGSSQGCNPACKTA